MIPDELEEYMRTHQDRSLLGGYIRLLEKDRREALTGAARRVTAGYGDMEIFARTAFGDLFGWDGSFVYKVDLLSGKIDVLLSGFRFFFSVLEDSAFRKEHFDMELYTQLTEKLGKLDANEVFGFSPVPALGGRKTPESAFRTSDMEYISMLIDMRAR